MASKSADPLRHVRVLERRAARARRSKWLGRCLFSLSGMTLLLALRMNPDVLEQVIAHAHDVPRRTDTGEFQAPQDVLVRHMPRDVIPVRRAGVGPETARQDHQTQAQAEQVADKLRVSAPGG